MLPRSAGTDTNCSAVSLMVPYTLAPKVGATVGTTASGIVTLARSSAVILIALLSLGFAIVPLLAALIGSRRLARLRWIRLAGIRMLRAGCGTSTGVRTGVPGCTSGIRISRLGDDLSRARVD